MLQAQKTQKSPAILRLKNGKHERPATHKFEDICGKLRCIKDRLDRRTNIMDWLTPQHEEIELNCEISSYANAEL